MSDTMALTAPGRPLLEYLPVGLFGSVMGLTGLSVAWRLAQARYGLPDWIAPVIAAAAALAFVALAIGYGIKLATAAPGVVWTEFRHPIAGNLFGLVWIACCCCRSCRATSSARRDRAERGSLDSNLGRLRQGQRVLGVAAQVAHRALELGVAE